MDPQDTEHLGPSGLPHFQYKQARLQALETMADVLKQRIDILTTKLHKSTSPDTAGDLASDMPPLGPSTAPATPTLTPPSYLRSLVSDGSRGTPQDWVDTQGKPLLSSTYVQDSPSWKPLSSNLGTHIESQPQGGTGQWASCLLADPWAGSDRAPFLFLSGSRMGAAQTMRVETIADAP